MSDALPPCSYTMNVERRPTGEHLDARQRRTIHSQHQIHRLTAPEIAVMNDIAPRTVELVLHRGQLMDSVVRNPRLEGSSRRLGHDEREVHISSVIQLCTYN